MRRANKNATSQNDGINSNAVDANKDSDNNNNWLIRESKLSHTDDATAPEIPEINERELLERCKRGDNDAWEQLISIYHTRVYSTAYRMLGNHDDAMDAAQDVFIRVFEKVNSFRGASSLGTWIYRITVNICLDYLKRRREVTFSSLNPDEHETTLLIPDPSPSPEDVAERKEVQELVHRALEQLAPEHRAVIVLCDLEQLSYDEAAQVLGIPLGTLKSRLNRGRLALKDILLKLMSADGSQKAH
ncbi:MAG TPA: sigma-70 family RNA polymerase sigma factor [Armatimonadetes bacterium]|nr:sigma-70 family RNA polymerase sigma factor [Armatimonadota bacterium]